MWEERKWILNYQTHLLQQEMFRRFAENEIKPIAEEMDETKYLIWIW